MVHIHPDGITGSDRRAFYRLSKRSKSVPVSLPLGAAFIWLDPAITSPNVMLGVRVSGHGEFIMRPGDVVPVRGDNAAVKVWNAHANFNGALYQNGQVGFIGLRAGTAAELPFVVHGMGRKRDPLPLANVIFAGTIEAGAVLAQVSTANLTGVRITVLPLNAGGTALANVPADFAATIMPSVLTYGRISGVAFLAAAPAEEVPIIGLEEEAPMVAGWGALASDRTMVASNTNYTWEWPVVAQGPWMQLGLSGLAGTGISLTRAALFVEGR